MSNILCPKCGSEKLHSDKHAGKIRLTCLACAHEFKPGGGAKNKYEVKKNQKAEETTGALKAGCFLIFLVVIGISMCKEVCSSDSESMTITATASEGQREFDNFAELATLTFDSLSKSNVSKSENISMMDDITTVFSDRVSSKIDGWRGTVIGIDSYEDEQLDIAFTLVPTTKLGVKEIKGRELRRTITIEASQAQHSKSGLAGIEREGPLYESVKDLKRGDLVKFSGRIVSSSNAVEKTGLNLSMIFNVALDEVEVVD